MHTLQYSIVRILFFGIVSGSSHFRLIGRIGPSDSIKPSDGVIEIPGMLQAIWIPLVFIYLLVQLTKSIKFVFLFRGEKAEKSLTFGKWLYVTSVYYLERFSARADVHKPQSRLIIILVEADLLFIRNDHVDNAENILDMVENRVRSEK